MPVLPTFVALPFGMEKNKNSSVSTLLTVIITVAAVISCQLLCYQTNSSVKLDVKTEQQETEEGQIFLSLSSAHLPTSATVVLHQTMFVLFEICFEELKAAPVRTHIQLPPNRIYRTLISSAISPNAP
jgi:hypothetical protein